MTGAAIDAHLHLWDQERLTYPWLAGSPALDRSFLPADLDVGDSGVGGFVFVQADCVAEQSRDEVEWVASIPPSILPIEGIVAFAPLENGARVSEELAELAERDRVVGVRRLLQDETDEFLADAALAEGLREVAHAGLTFDACVRWQQLPVLIELLGRVAARPTVILDHLGKPPVSAGYDSAEGRAWLSSIRALCAMEDVFMKLSGIAPETARGTDLAVAAAPFLGAALEAFGPGRCLVGSDWPVSAEVPERRAYDSWFRLVLDDQGLTRDEREAVAHRTAVTAYRL